MAKDQIEAIVIGGSAGSLDVLLEVLPGLRAGFEIPVIIILHRKYYNGDILVNLLSAKTLLTVKEVEEKEFILPGYVYIAPADYHLLVEKDRTMSLDDSEKINYSRPSIDVSFESFAKCFKERLAGIILSGANADGTEGIKIIKEHNGITIAQLPDEATVSYMPQNAISDGYIDSVLNTEGIISFLNNLK